MLIIKIIIIILLFIIIFSLFLPLLRNEEYHYDTDGLTTLKELEIEKKYLERQLEDLLLDKDSGKITEEEWEILINPLKEKLNHLVHKIQQLRNKV
jgi:uncharacterized membrane protein YvbJ